MIIVTCGYNRGVLTISLLSILLAIRETIGRFNIFQIRSALIFVVLICTIR